MQASKTGEGYLSLEKALSFEKLFVAERTPHPALRATFSHKGRRESSTSRQANEPAIVSIVA
jgi:hypothetical protein